MKTYSDRLLEKYLLQDKSQKPVHSFLRNLLYCLGSAFSAAISLAIIGNKISAEYLAGIFIISSGIFFFGWGAERLWYASVSKMVQNPFSLFAYLTRIPFWFVGSGIGLSLPVLFAYKWGLIYISVVPQCSLFLLGGIIGCLVQIPLQLQVLRFLAKRVDVFG
jgi:hypothetical protein